MHIYVTIGQPIQYEVKYETKFCFLIFRIVLHGWLIQNFDLLSISIPKPSYHILKLKILQPQ